MDILAPVKAFDRFQQHHRGLAVPMAVIKKFADDQAGNMAALVAYYGFFSLFPLLLVFVTILGYVFSGNSSVQSSIEGSALSQFPIIGDQIRANVHGLHGHSLALVIGVLGALWGGLGVTNATQTAFDRVWAVPFKARPDFLQRRLRGLKLLFTLGLLFIVSTGVSGFVTGGLGNSVLSSAAGIAVSLALDFALFLSAFRFMTTATVKTSELWIGVVVATVLWEILQLVGSYYIGHVFRHETSTYGVFGLVLAMLVWLHLGALVTLYSVELNVVLKDRLWPRSLLGPPQRPADEATYTRLAKVEERHPVEQVDVDFRR